jgi:hypothetical protein
MELTKQPNLKSNGGFLEVLKFDKDKAVLFIVSYQLRFVG